MQLGAIPTKTDIKEVCGAASYSRGRTYFNDGRVRKLVYDESEECYYAEVQGNRKYKVSVSVDEHIGITEASCNCPAFDSYYEYCKHVAAVLLQIENYGKLAAKRDNLPAASDRSPTSLASPRLHIVQNVPSPAISERDAILARTVLGLFERQLDSGPATLPGTSPVRMSEAVKVEYILQMATGYRNVIGIELKVGLDRMYVVQKIRDFLDKQLNGTVHVFGKNFTFNPAVHVFTQTDAGIMRILQDVYSGEKLFREMNGGYYSSYSQSGDRLLSLTPAAWDAIYPLLPADKTRIYVDGFELASAVWKEEIMPLPFKLGGGPIDGSFRLDLGPLLAYSLLPPYGLAVHKNGELYRMDKAGLQRLAELQKALGTVKDGTITIPPSEADGFFQKAVPVLKRLGSFSAEAGIADRLVSEPLKAKVYLDRQNDVLTARVSFHYGDFELWPLQSQKKVESVDGRIVMREGERELQLMNWLRDAAFEQRGDRLYMMSEEEEYRFLYTGLVDLQQIAEVFATDAVDAMGSKLRSRPKATVEVDQQTNWLEVRFELEGVSEKDLQLLLRSLSEKRKYHRLSDGGFVSLEEDDFQELGRLFEELDIRKSELKSDSLRVPIVRGLSLTGQDKGGNTAVKHGKALRRLLDNLNHPDNVDAEPPAALAPILRDYQKYGFMWMKTLGAYGFGGILADDMGLGKTLQSIAYIVSERERHEFGGAPVLIICPASLVFNWRNELHKFAPQLKTVVAAGVKTELDALLESALEADVLITSYPLVRRDAEWYAGQSFRALILDEAQAIKNSATQTAQTIKTISARQRFALTGTPVENRLEELWSIYDAVFPELFSGRKAFTDMTPERVARKVKPFLLRRVKKDVLKELPDKIETRQVSELLPEQKKLYMAYLMQLKSETLQQLEADGFQKSRMKILAGLTRLRQLCCHPALFLEQYDGQSGKMEQLFELIDECLGAGKRMLIFSQFTGMLELIRAELASRKHPCFYLDGNTKSEERVKLCARFNEGENDIFLISLKAGGTGLNLTGADTVILYDLWWNPAVEQQAADRAHRMGQKKVVQVIRLIAEGTIEEKMVELQQRKKDLIDAVVQPGEEAISALTEADIRELLTL